MGALQMETAHAEWLARCQEVLRESGGIFDKPLGDGFLAFWPAGESTAAAVARALFDFKRLQSTGALPFRMVLHLGTAFAGGEIASGVYRLFGSDVVFTFRMEALAKALRLRCLLSARARAGLDVAATSAGCHTLAGLDDPVEFFTL
jgi:class 3 adenylate cyclase